MLTGLWHVSRTQIKDGRGCFSRWYCANEFSAVGVTKPIVQINHSHSNRAGTIRGLHFQRHPFQEIKIVSCLSGRVFDVAVDLRKNSDTFLQWFGIELSAENDESLVIPEGFAHGFQTLEPDTMLVYYVTAVYTATAEDGLHPFDAAIGVTWPLPLTDISDRDMQRPFIESSKFSGVSHG